MREVTGSISSDRNKKLKPSGTGVPGFTSTVLPDSDVPHFCQLKSCVEELCGHIRETVVWERNMGKEHGKGASGLMGRWNEEWTWKDE